MLLITRIKPSRSIIVLFWLTAIGSALCVAQDLHWQAVADYASTFENIDTADYRQEKRTRFAVYDDVTWLAYTYYRDPNGSRVGLHVLETADAGATWELIFKSSQWGDASGTFEIADVIYLPNRDLLYVSRARHLRYDRNQQQWSVVQFDNTYFTTAPQTIKVTQVHPWVWILQDAKGKWGISSDAGRSFQRLFESEPLWVSPLGRGYYDRWISRPVSNDPEVAYQTDLGDDAHFHDVPALGLIRTANAVFDRDGLSATVLTQESLVKHLSPGTMIAARDGCSIMILGFDSPTVYRSADYGMSWEQDTLTANWKQTLLAVHNQQGTEAFVYAPRDSRLWRHRSTNIAQTLRWPQSDAVDEPSRITLVCPATVGAETEVQVATDRQMTEVIHQASFQGAHTVFTPTEPLTQHYWRYREIADGQPQPWSDVWSFHTGSLQSWEVIHVGMAFTGQISERYVLTTSGHLVVVNTSVAHVIDRASGDTVHTASMPDGLVSLTGLWETARGNVIGQASNGTFYLDLEAGTVTALPNHQLSRLRVHQTGTMIASTRVGTQSEDVVESRDDGHTWTTVTNNLLKAQSIAMRHDGYVWIGTGYWRQPSPTPSGYVWEGGIHGYYPESGFIYRLLTDPLDGDDTNAIQQVNMDYTTDGVLCTNHYFSSFGSIRESRDDGRTWKPVFDDRLNAASIRPEFPVFTSDAQPLVYLRSRQMLRRFPDGRWADASDGRFHRGPKAEAPNGAPFMQRALSGELTGGHAYDGRHFVSILKDPPSLQGRSPLKGARLAPTDVIRLTWPATTEGAAYVVEVRRRDQSGWASVALAEVAEASHAIGSLPPGRYMWRYLERVQGDPGRAWHAWSEFVVESAVSVSEDASPVLGIHPNPATDRIEVKCGDRPMRCEVRTLQGQLMFHTDLLPGRNSVEVASLPSGPYIITTTSAHEVSSAIITIMR